MIVGSRPAEGGGRGKPYVLAGSQMVREIAYSEVHCIRQRETGWSRAVKVIRQGWCQSLGLGVGTQVSAGIGTSEPGGIQVPPGHFLLGKVQGAVGEIGKGTWVEHQNSKLR